MCEIYTWRKAKHIHKRQTLFSSERMLHKAYDRKSSVEKETVVVTLEGLGAKMNWLTVNRES
jgi:hypothetical protein